MKYLAIFLSIVTSFFLTQSAKAQIKLSNTLQAPPSNIIVDGNITEWGDSLRYYNAEKKLNYSLANDKDNLYMAIRVNDHSEQMRILNAGLTISINTKGKKKETYSITFPVGGSDNHTAMENLVEANDPGAADDHDEMMRARLTKLRNIRVSGFPDIESDMITTANTYGIQVAITYDDNGYLNYEAAIPMKFFHADNPAKNEWAFNFKINGVTSPGTKPNTQDGDIQMMGNRGGMGGGRGGMGGGMGGMRGGGRGVMRGSNSQNTLQDHSEMSKSIDFWEKFYLSGNSQ